MRQAPPLSQGQIKLLQVARRQVGLDEDAWRDLLERVTGQRSAKGLTQRQFEAVIGELERAGFRSTSAKKPYGHRLGFASAQQLALIRHLWLEWSGGTGTEAGLRTFVERTAKVSDLRFLDHSGAAACTAALRSMCARHASAPPPAA